MTNASLTITHSPAEGTLLHGTSKGDGAGKALKNVPAGSGQWRWSADIDAWYIRQSRNRPARQWQIDNAAQVLRAAGWDVTVEISTERRSVAEREAEKAERAEHRADYLSERAERLTERGQAGWAAAREYASHIPMGQPILVDHYSAPKHRRTLAKIDRMEDRAIEQLKDGEDAARRAKAAEDTQRHRVHGGTIMRRLDKLRADLGRVERGTSCADGDDLREQIDYWAGYLTGLEEAGVYKVWSRADFAKGDRVSFRFGWSEVLRVNAKSVTIPHIHEQLAAAGYTSTINYDDVRGRISAADWAAAEAKRAG
jgi:hypothetical protein